MRSVRSRKASARCCAPPANKLVCASLPGLSRAGVDRRVSSNVDRRKFSVSVRTNRKTLYTNGEIIPFATNSGEAVTALLTEGARVVAAGAEQDVAAVAGKDAERVDLRARAGEPQRGIHRGWAARSDTSLRSTCRGARTPPTRRSRAPCGCACIRHRNTTRRAEERFRPRHRACACSGLGLAVNRRLDGLQGIGDTVEVL